MKLIKKLASGIFYFALLYAFYLGIGFEYSVILGLSLILQNQE